MLEKKPFSSSEILSGVSSTLTAANRDESPNTSVPTEASETQKHLLHNYSLQLRSIRVLTDDKLSEIENDIAALKDGLFLKGKGIDKADAVGVNNMSQNVMGSEKINDLTNGHTAPAGDHSIASLKWTIIGTIIATGFGLAGLIFSMLQTSITAAQSVRDETVAKTEKIQSEIHSNNNETLLRIESSNQGMVNEVKSLKQDILGIGKELDYKMRIQEINIDNKIQKNQESEKRK